ncbi:BirA family transcriptional regulator, biotin operon repressor / biotin-[acetyl-CoA-carboxylase] ligase [Evansella caseinilytica]|uniref:Bifunctional ligase/repressor BirA n=1 Tax=Evansella caseinilytica TaxID=1503961 RepID=A0A1H3NIS7_9BACI|nr:biotin--[acetyl-CoA-carboxylase] ligase [Evansella caseinilytica]SDY88139.1 BirA family transcriptional regulator, biotin operon repressor / biotin-[acetyl-CoA-carboxylase] ligase [Evansella caseinilytica]
MKTKVLQLLRNHRDDYLSGEKISALLSCSRTMVWKYIDALRKEGYEIEAISNKGYKFIGEPDRLSEHEVLSRLDPDTFVQKVVYEDLAESTQQLAHALVHAGAETGTVVIANQQTSGRGRLGRNWYSPANTGIWMSLILKPDMEIRKAPQLTLVAAVAAARAVRQVCGIDADIKWPNDLLLHNKKIAGILTEMQAEMDQMKSVVIGIGMNVNEISFPSGVHEVATSLKKETGKCFKRADIVVSILNEFQWLYDAYLTKGFPFIKPLWEARAVTIGKEITAKTHKDTIVGTAEGIDDEGVLLIKDKAGHHHRIYSADIEAAND